MQLVYCCTPPAMTVVSRPARYDCCNSPGGDLVVLSFRFQTPIFPPDPDSYYSYFLGALFPILKLAPLFIY
uniref:Uncharacterized protein n=2 Tax=Picea TaxID=3328 RepID=A0A101M4Y6_PICGL|nr:hypothetical protein ABT39_MTgene1030 [Picea glauca]QHR90049.1 hypothetical protein Q903MT_gene4072 [Picea sitchensis]